MTTDDILKDLELVQKASHDQKLNSIGVRDKVIADIGKAIIDNAYYIKRENQKDLEKMDKNDPMYDRLLLDEERIEGIAKSCSDLVKIKDPLLKYKDNEPIVTPEGLTIRKKAISLGVVACIYESRPNVTVDIAIMAIKSGNGVVLRGGSAAYNSNLALIKIIKDVLQENNLDKNLVYSFPIEREYLGILYTAFGLVDLIIPRGGKGLIDSVRNNSKIPVIETGAGVVHLYLDDEIEDFGSAIEVIINAKAQRVSVCNALDTLLVNKNIESNKLKELFDDLAFLGVTFGLEESDKKYMPDYKTATISDKDFYTEQLSLNLHIKFLDSVEEAVDHVLKYSSKHSDGILSDNEGKLSLFENSIDSSVVYKNTSTRFSDGSCFGFAGEIGISTQKLHVRGPMGAQSLVSYKYIVDSDWKSR